MNRWTEEERRTQEEPGVECGPAGKYFFFFKTRFYLSLSPLFSLWLFAVPLVCGIIKKKKKASRYQRAEAEEEEEEEEGLVVVVVISTGRLDGKEVIK